MICRFAFAVVTNIIGDVWVRTGRWIVQVAGSLGHLRRLALLDGCKGCIMKLHFWLRVLVAHIVMLHDCRQLT